MLSITIVMVTIPRPKRQWHAKPVHQELGGYGDDNGNLLL